MHYRKQATLNIHQSVLEKKTLPMSINIELQYRVYVASYSEKSLHQIFRM